MNLKIGDRVTTVLRLHPKKYPVTLKIGDRVTTPSGETGVIIPSEWLMPVHHLVQLGGGSKRWMLGEILKPAQAKTKQRRKPA